MISHSSSAAAALAPLCSRDDDDDDLAISAIIAAVGIGSLSFGPAERASTLQQRQCEQKRATACESAACSMAVETPRPLVPLAARPAIDWARACSLTSSATECESYESGCSVVALRHFLSSSDVDGGRPRPADVDGLEGRLERALPRSGEEERSGDERSGDERWGEEPEPAPASSSSILATCWKPLRLDVE